MLNKNSVKKLNKKRFNDPGWKEILDKSGPDNMNKTDEKLEHETGKKITDKADWTSSIQPDEKA